MGTHDDGDTTIRVAKIHDLRRNPPPAEDVLILVDRLWPRGVAKHDVALDGWFKDVAPSPELRTWFDHDPAKFAEFSDRYRHELDAGHGDELSELISMAGDATVAEPLVLVYAAHDREHNHALVLADWLRRHLGRFGHSLGA